MVILHKAIIAASNEPPSETNSQSFCNQLSVSHAACASFSCKLQGRNLYILQMRIARYARAGSALQGTGVSDIDQLQTTWCRYADQQVQRGATWLAYKSPSVQRRLVQKTPPSSQVQVKLPAQQIPADKDTLTRASECLAPSFSRQLKVMSACSAAEC